MSANQPTLVNRLHPVKSTSSPTQSGSRSSSKVAVTTLAVFVFVSGLLVPYLAGVRAGSLGRQTIDPVTEINHAGTPGRTWQVGSLDPVLGQAPRPYVSAGLMMGPRSPFVVNGSIFYTDYSSRGVPPELVRVDLRSGETIWRNPINAPAAMASDGRSIFVIASSGYPGVIRWQPVALDIDSGEIVWRGLELSSTGIHSTDIVVDGDSVFAADDLGNVIRMDRVTGETIWQYPPTFSQPVGDGLNLTAGLSVYSHPELAVGNDALYVVRPSRSVVRIDRETGRETGLINIPDDYVASARFVGVVVADPYLLVMASSYISYPLDRGASISVTPTELLLFESGTLELTWRRPVTDLRGNIAIHGETLFVPQGLLDPSGGGISDDPSIEILPISLADMRTGPAVTGFGDAEWVGLSVAGQTLMVTSPPRQIGLYAIDDLQLTRAEQLEIPFFSKNTEVSWPALVDGTTCVVFGRGFAGEVVLLGDDVPSATTPASPTPAPATS